MKCFRCPYMAYVEDEFDNVHEICSFSQSAYFLEGTTGDCDIPDTVMEFVKSDPNHVGQCCECKHWKKNQRVCNDCIYNVEGGDGDNWEPELMEE